MRIKYVLVLIISGLFALLTSCKVEQPLQGNYADKVYPLLDTENSRWFFFSSASRPFGMVNLSPDTEIDGAWGSGYRYKTDTIKGFSHIHAWQMSGLSVMPVTLKSENSTSIYSDFYSSFSHESEKVSPGYHYVELDRYNIKAELTSSKRVGLHKYVFPENENGAILFNLNTMLGPCKNKNGKLEKVNNKELKGTLEAAATHRRPKPLKIYFRIQFDQTIGALEFDEKTENYLLNLNQNSRPVLMKVGISYTSSENASNNIQKELPGWSFESVVEDSKQEWNQLLSRIHVEGGAENDQRRFYTDLWHALQGRRIISDVNGAYPDNTGEELRIGQVPLDEKGEPSFNHYNSDSFWGAQWTLNTLWGLVYPEIMEEFVQSLLLYEKDGGMIPRGPSGGNYTYVMTGASSSPFIVSAIQKGIVKDNLEAIYRSVKKNHLTGGIMEKAGYEHKTRKGGGFSDYSSKGYVPYPNPEGRFGGHQDGASLTLEYAYQDWTLAQLSKKLGHDEDHDYFIGRSKNYANVYDKEFQLIRPKDINGNWLKDFDPFKYENGFNESNGAQSTWFVPHDLNGLAALMGGNDNAIDKLNAQFEEAEKLGFTSGNSHDLETHPEYRRIPINYGNQPSMQTAFIFSKLGKPSLTHYWSRKVTNTVFGKLGPGTGYNGDEDQGLMGSLAVLMKIGLFQMNGGTESNPSYQIGSPIFDKVKIKLNSDYYEGASFTIEAVGNSSDAVYVKSASWNERNLDTYSVKHQDLTSGGTLKLNMVDKNSLSQ